MINRTQLSKEAYYSSIKVRKNLGIQLNVPITISDTIEKYGIELRFIDTKSIEGLYSKDPGPLILIGAYRPKGRQVFTCAHEFAHHVFEHGSHFDEIKENLYRDSEEEFLADSFAGYFLMPPSAINIIMKKKEWNYNKLTPFQILYLSNYFKVGYITMIDHLFYSLRLITYDKAKEFKNTQKKEIYIDFLKMEINSDLLVIDDCFQNNIDLTIADYIFAPHYIQYEGNDLTLEKDLGTGKLYRAYFTGISRFINTENNWALFCRVSKKEYVGRNKFRHLREADDE